VRKKIICTASTIAAKAGQQFLVGTGKTSPTNQPRKDPFHLYSLSPHSPQFQQSAGATPLYSPSETKYTKLLKKGGGQKLERTRRKHF
jgi:hypothetical protein